MHWALVSNLQPGVTTLSKLLLPCVVAAGMFPDMPGKYLQVPNQVMLSDYSRFWMLEVLAVAALERTFD